VEFKSWKHADNLPDWWGCDTESMATRTGQFVAWQNQFILVDCSQMFPRSYISNWCTQFRKIPENSGMQAVLFFCIRVHLPRFCQPLDRVIICRVESGQIAIQLRQRAWVDNVRHRLGLGHRSTGSSLLDAKSFDRCHSGSAVQYTNDSAQTTVVEEGYQSQDVGLWGRPLSGNWPVTINADIQLSLQERSMLVHFAATVAFLMSDVVVDDWRYPNGLASCYKPWSCWSVCLLQPSFKGQVAQYLPRLGAKRVGLARDQPHGEVQLWVKQASSDKPLHLACISFSLHIQPM